MKSKYMSCLLCALVIVSWAMFSPQFAQSAEQVVVRIGHQPNINHVNALIADKKGFFKEEGLSFERQEMIAGAPLRDALIVGSLDIAQMGSTPGIATAARGVPVTAVMTAYMGGGIVSFVLSSKSPATDPCQTKGMRIGLFIGSMAHYGVMSALNHHCGFTEKDYDLIMMKPADALVQLEAGLVDGIFMWEDFSSIAVVGRKIGKYLIDGRSAEGFLGAGIAMANNNFVKKHPDLIVKYIRASAKAYQFVVNNFDEAVDIVVASWKKPRDVTIAAMKRTYYDPRITKEVVESWNGEAEWQLAKKKIKKLPDWDRFVDDRFAKEAVKGMDFPVYIPGSIYQ